MIKSFFLSAVILLFIQTDLCLAKTIKLNEKDNFKTIEARVGDRLVVTLSGNPTTGYAWEKSSPASKILKQMGEPKFQRESKLIGAGGKFSWLFYVTGAGKTELKLVYRRPWEKDVEPVNTFEINITAK